MAAKKPPPSIEARILSALRVAGRPLTVSQLHGPGRPGLTSRRSSEIHKACERLFDQGLLDRMEFWINGRGQRTDKAYLDLVARIATHCDGGGNRNGAQ